MKKLLLAVGVFALVAPDIALAQQQQQSERSREGATRPMRPGAGGPQVQPPRPGAGGAQIQPPRPVGPQPPRPPRPGNGGPQIQPPRPGNGVRPRPPRPPRPIVLPGRPHRPGAGRPHGFRPIHGPSFRYPHGYRYRRWTVGLLLPSLFLSTTYYYNNYAALGVGPPPPGYRWVRYGPDLLLVQRGSG
ncbi:RcnB family protein, partial [Sphingomonas sp.]|uniref:RcnB family protein n=1 Tax=Sphingomonas sp. TaxID=28214 RepID=UPI0025F5BAC4